MFIGEPEKKYRVGIHRSNGYQYASTQPTVKNPRTGRSESRQIHWGTVDENKKFYPNRRFVQASAEERARLLFPADWDLSEIEREREESLRATTMREVRYQKMLEGAAWNESKSAPRAAEPSARWVFNLIKKLEEEQMSSDKILEIVKAVEG